MGHRRRSKRDSDIADRLECNDLVFGEKEARNKLPANLRIPSAKYNYPITGIPKKIVEQLWHVFPMTQ